MRRDKREEITLEPLTLLLSTTLNHCKRKDINSQSAAARSCVQLELLICCGSPTSLSKPRPLRKSPTTTKKQPKVPVPHSWQLPGRTWSCQLPKSPPKAHHHTWAHTYFVADTSLPLDSRVHKHPDLAGHVIVIFSCLHLWDLEESPGRCFAQNKTSLLLFKFSLIRLTDSAKKPFIGGTENLLLRPQATGFGCCLPEANMDPTRRKLSSQNAPVSYLLNVPGRCSICASNCGL